jgi:hypothetical protein
VPDSTAPSAVAFGLVLAVLVNAIGFWLFAKLLGAADIVDWDLSWSKASGMAAIYLVVRMFNHTLFFKKR